MTNRLATIVANTAGTSSKVLYYTSTKRVDAGHSSSPAHSKDQILYSNKIYHGTDTPLQQNLLMKFISFPAFSTIVEQSGTTIIPPKESLKLLHRA